MNADRHLRIQRRENRQIWRALSATVAACLALYLVTVHAEHFFDGHAATDESHLAHAGPIAGFHAPVLGLDASQSRAHCALPSMLVRQLEAPLLIAPLVIWLPPVLMLATAVQRALDDGWNGARPPGPTRQAILHCFRL